MQYSITLIFRFYKLIRRNSLKFSLLIFILFTAILKGMAQTDFREGYYITLENDTVFGLVDYRGEVKVILINHGAEPFTIERGMRIAQMVMARYERADWDLVDSLDETARGSGGFGSTGTN